MVYLNTIINGYTEAGLVSKYKAKDLVIPKELANQKMLLILRECHQARLIKTIGILRF